MLIVTGDRWGEWGQQIGQELWRVPFTDWDEPHELRAEVRCVPRRFVVSDADGLVRASGYTTTPTCLAGEPFILKVAEPLAAQILEGRRIVKLRPSVQAEVDRLVQEALERSPGKPGIIGGRSVAGDPRSLRGIPMIGGEAGGAIPGTTPHRQRRFDYWQPKAR
jgi:hypothetical protein